MQPFHSLLLSPPTPHSQLSTQRKPVHVTKNQGSGGEGSPRLHTHPGLPCPQAPWEQLCITEVAHVCGEEQCEQEIRKEKEDSSPSHQWPLATLKPGPMIPNLGKPRMN